MHSSLYFNHLSKNYLTDVKQTACVKTHISLAATVTQGIFFILQLHHSQVNTVILYWAESAAKMLLVHISTVAKCIQCGH